MSFHESVRKQLVGLAAHAQVNEEAQLTNGLQLLSKWRSIVIQNVWLHHQGTKVLHGPFSGMDFLRHSAEDCHLPKLLGCYEQPLQPFIEAAIQSQYSVILNIGCAEGYYAVGMACRMPHSRVFAFDPSLTAQQVCTELATKNKVTNRVTVGALFKPDEFVSYQGLHVLVLCDFKGAECELLNPVNTPALVEMDIIVKSYENLTPGVTQLLIERFKESHQIILVQDNGQRHLLPMPDWFNKLAHLDQLIATWEWRNGATSWLVMKAICRQKDQVAPSIEHKKLTPIKKNKDKSTVARFQKAPLQTQAPSQAEVGALLNHYKSGRYDDAEKLARSLTQKFPHNQFGWKILGVLLKQAGQFELSLDANQTAVRLIPKDAEAHNNLGITLQVLGRFEEAEASCRRAVALRPDLADAHFNLGNTLKDLGRLEDAEACFRKTIQLNRDHAKAHNNLGALLKDLGRLEDAEASYRKAIQINPSHSEALSNLGATLRDLGKLEESIVYLEKSLALAPNVEKVHSNLGVTLQTLGRLQDSEVSFRKSIALNPEIAEVHSNLGVTLDGLGKLEGAEASFRRAIALKPSYAKAHSNLGVTLQNLGRLGDAESSCLRALEIDPNNSDAFSNFLFCRIQNEEINTALLFEQHREFGERFESSLQSKWPKHNNVRVPERCLQVGFVSGDFRHHSVANFIEPVLAHLASYPQLSLHAYYNHAINDDHTERLRNYFDHWYPVSGLSDTNLAENIRRDRIDILIDLSGHTARNRLLTFAHKPAPIQVSWIGYPGTSGLMAMDYYLADRFLLPLEQFENQFVEKIVYLPANVPFQPDANSPPINPLPALKNGYITFGTFNRRAKLSRSIIALWSRLLSALPNARLVLGGMAAESDFDLLIEWFAHEGIASDRLSFFTRRSMSVYLSLHHEVDICLDTFPYNGGTTTCHALWMGVPTLTLAGSTMPSRAGASLLGNVGLEAFVAHTKAEFVQNGLYWAEHIADLNEIRCSLRNRFRQSTLQTPLIAASLECALRTMWKRWCIGLPADTFDVPPQGAIIEPQKASS